MFVTNQKKRYAKAKLFSLHVWENSWIKLIQLQKDVIILDKILTWISNEPELILKECFWTIFIFGTKIEPNTKSLSIWSKKTRPLGLLGWKWHDINALPETSSLKRTRTKALGSGSWEKDFTCLDLHSSSHGMFCQQINVCQFFSPNFSSHSNSHYPSYSPS